MRLAAPVAFVAGICVLQWQPALPSAAAIVATALAGGVLLAGGIAGRAASAPARPALLTAAAALAGFAYAAALAAHRLADVLPFEAEGRSIVVEGVVASLPARLERGARFEFEVARVLTEGAAVPRRLLLGWYGEPPPAVRPAERWRFAVRLKRPHGVLNPGGFDIEAWLLERNLRATGAVRSGRADPPPQRIDAWVLAPGALVERARFALRERLAPRLEARRHGGVLMALILGDQRAIGAQDWTLFNRTGIAHLVSISGLHITMIAGLAGTCVAAVWRRTAALVARAPAQAAGVWAGLGAAVAYALLAGWGIPAQRTVMMLAVVAAAWLARTRSGLGAALAWSAAVVCALDPWAVLAAGFWLSFGAVAAIAWIVGGRVADPATPAWRRAARAAVLVQLAVTLALVPATVALFHQLSLVSPLANAVAIPLVSWIVTPLALVGAAVALLPPPFALAADALFGAAHAVFAAVSDWLTWLAAWPGAFRAVATPPAPIIALAAGGIAWWLAPPGWPARWLGAFALAPLFVWPAARPAAGELWVTALDVGQGSAVLVESRDRAWLYDTGPRYSGAGDAGERIVLPYLRHRGIARLDGLVVSHLDADHSGGTAAILRALPVARVVTSIDRADPMFGGRAVERCEAGQRWRDGALDAAVLHPAASDYARQRPTNAMSCVLTLGLGARRLLLTGDIGVADERALLARTPAPAVEWLAAPHHGSRSSSSDALLAAVGAREAVAQAGYRNRHGHPDPAVAARYAAHGIALHRTDHAGALQWRLRADGRTDRSAWRTEAVRYWHNRPGLPARAADDADEPHDDIPFEPFIAG